MLICAFISRLNATFRSSQDASYKIIYLQTTVSVGAPWPTPPEINFFINPPVTVTVTNGLSHPYHLDVSIVIFRGNGSIACVRDSPNGTIGNFTNGSQWYHWYQRTLNVFRQPMVPLVPMLPLVETFVPMVPLVVPMVVPTVSTVI